MTHQPGDDRYDKQPYGRAAKSGTRVAARR
jgi:hypothetical protein